MSELWGNFDWFGKSRGGETVGLVVICGKRGWQGWMDGICQRKGAGTDACREKTEGLNI